MAPASRRDNMHGNQASSGETKATYNKDNKEMMKTAVSKTIT